MRNRPQWIIVRYVPRPDGKTDKLPIDHRTCAVYTAGSGWQSDHTAWTTYDSARFLASTMGNDYGVGFLFTPNDPYFFIDIDGCLTPSGWSPLALELLNRFPGAAVEVSQSGKGLHIFGSYRGESPPHGCKNVPLGLELYTEGRFVAYTGDQEQGDPNTNCAPALVAAIDRYFTPAVTCATPLAWNDQPAPEYTGPADDLELIERMLNSKQGASSVFGGKATPSDLWNNVESVLSVAYPDPSGERPYDSSSVDAALAQHLAFWTGKNHERIRRLMLRSALVRDKWDREDYLVRTITRAVNLQTAVYSVPAPAPGASQSLAGTASQSTWAERIRAEKLAEHPEGEQIFQTISNASWWIENRFKSGSELAAMLTPIERATARPTDGPEYTVGWQSLGPEQQVDHFKGCTYVLDAHRVFCVDDGTLLKAEQFNSKYGGYQYLISSNGKKKPTKNSFEAFTESELVKYPLAQSTCFQPSRPPGEIINRDGRPLVNIYVPIYTGRRQGDSSRFFDLINRILPNADDRAILIAYLAALIQHKGVKFQWAPLVQGTQGNGKSFITSCMAHCIGEKYVHEPPAHEIGEKFNEWVFDKLLISVQDIYIPEQKRELIEILKPMITEKRLPCRAMHQAQVMRDICANFILNSNHKNAVMKTAGDRRLAIFYTAQQRAEDIGRDGMSGNYFPDLYNWARGGGYEFIHEALATYPIPDALNPANAMHRAPRTSSTIEAIEASLGSVEQQILEAIDEGRPGFSGGWVSSNALDLLLRGMRRDNSIPISKRRELLQDLGYDWHPALKGGRVNNPVLPDAGRPRLFIKKGHLALNITNPARVAEAYQKAQGVLGMPGSAAEVFK